MTVYEWRISDWVSDVFSSDLAARRRHPPHHALRHRPVQVHLLRVLRGVVPRGLDRRNPRARVPLREPRREHRQQAAAAGNRGPARNRDRTEEHTSEIQSLMRISYAGFCLKTKKKKQQQ